MSNILTKMPIDVAIIMSAVVPTIGHKNLVQFALSWASFTESFANSHVHLIISGIEGEPIHARQRAEWFKKEFFNEVRSGALIVHYDVNDLPQKPTGDPSFWTQWADFIKNKINVSKTSKKILMASELYGIELAKALNYEFIPYDIDRDMTFSLSSSDVRRSLIDNFNGIMDSAKPYFHVRATVFGAESIGKSTLTQKIAEIYGSMTPEWARQYLETVGPELTEEKMANIVRGQVIIQQEKKNSVPTSPITIQDTDLFSTIGYYRILGWKVPDELVRLAIAFKSDIYLVLKSDIPFEPDPLRYGGDKRQSTDQFWIDILEEFNLNYMFVERGGPFPNTTGNEIEEYYNKKYAQIRNYKKP